MERDHGYLHREGGDEGESEPELYFRRDGKLIQRRHLESEDAVGLVIEKGQRDDGGQHEQTAEYCEQEELKSRHAAPLVTPDSDQEIHGDQHAFPEEEELEQVEGEEHAHQRGLHQQHEYLVGPDVLGDDRPGTKQRQGPHECGDPGEEDAYAVRTDVIGHAQGLDPGYPFHELRIADV